MNSQVKKQLRHKAMKKKVVARGQATSKKAISIITEKQSPLQVLVESLSKVDLIHTLQQKIGDELMKYQNEDGVVQPFRVPQNLYMVAIIYEVIEASKKLDLVPCVLHGVIYIFNGKYWQEIGDEEVKRALSNVAIRLGFNQPATARVSDFRDKLFKQFMSDAVNEAVVPEISNILINLNNGTLEINKDKVTLRQHNRDDFLTYVLGYDYNPDIAAPIFKNFIEEVLPDTATRHILQEFIGHIFSTGLKHEKCMVLFGSGANGKSVFFEIMLGLVGKENMSFKGLGDLCMKGDKGNNHRAEVDNKLVNYASEMDPKGADTDIFKAITSEEPVPARRLYKDVYTFRNSAKLIFNTNALPTETERTHAFFRRYIIIPFKVTIPIENQVKNLHKQIIEDEMSGVLNWAIAGLSRLLATGDFTTSTEVDEALEDFKKQSNSVLLFIDEYQIGEDEYGFISNQDLYKTYSEFCNESGYKRFSQNNVSKELIKIGFESHSKKMAGHTKRGFKIEFGDS